MSRIDFAFPQAALLLALAVMPTNAALADDESAVAGTVEIAAVAATPARIGTMSRVTFTIVNGGADPARIVGLRISTGEPSQLRGFLGTSHSTAMESIRVDADERLRLGRRTAWIEFGPLRSDLQVGQRVPATLVFERFEVDVSLHVTAPSDTPGEAKNGNHAAPSTRTERG